MKLPSSAEMRAFDEATIQSGLSSLALMERAGKAMFQATVRFFPQLSREDKNILVLAGPGNNGGDGIVLARYFIENGFTVTVVLAASDRYSPDFLTVLSKFLSVKKQIDSEQIGIFLFGDGTQPLTNDLLRTISSDEFKLKLCATNFIFDALLGTGSSGAPRGSIKQIIDLLNPIDPSVEIISLDVPSGINPDTGEVFSSHVTASLTLTVQLIKRGMIQYPAKECVGAIEVLDIGIKTESHTEYALLTPNSLSFIQPRNSNSHKGSFGRVLVIGGSSEMPGAPYLAAESAIRSGAGIVTVASGTNIVPKFIPEIMRIDLGTIQYHSEYGLAQIERNLKDNPVVILGPGLGMNENTSTFLSAVISRCIEQGLKVVVDADALNLIASTKKFPTTANFVYTPHPGEASRLLGTSTAEVQRDRYSSARSLTSLFKDGIVVLKGASTIITTSKMGWVNSTGNPYLATAGSGDVLTGIIAGLLAQGLETVEAAKLGVFIHGLCGDRAVAESQGPIIASDLFKHLPRTISEFVKVS